jgi:hypothetical protein
VSIPGAILPDLAVHLDKHTQHGPDALVFTGTNGGPLRRSGFNKLSGGPHVDTSMVCPACTLTTAGTPETPSPRGHGCLAAQPDGADGPRQRGPGGGLLRRALGSSACAGGELGDALGAYAEQGGDIPDRQPSSYQLNGGLAGAGRGGSSDLVGLAA